MSPTVFAIVHVALACLGAALCYFKKCQNAQDNEHCYSLSNQQMIALGLSVTRMGPHGSMPML